MERRDHPTFVRGLFTTSLALFVAAMICLGLGMVGERKELSILKTIGYWGFLVCVAGLPASWWWRSCGSRCPQCGRWLISDRARDRVETLKFPCEACKIEWDTKGTIDL